MVLGIEFVERNALNGWKVWKEAGKAAENHF
jgi:hypothetical protein